MHHPGTSIVHPAFPLLRVKAPSQQRPQVGATTPPPPPGHPRQRKIELDKNSDSNEAATTSTTATAEKNSWSSAHWRSPLFLPPHSPTTMTSRTWATVMREFRMATKQHTFEVDFHGLKCRVQEFIIRHTINFYTRLPKCASEGVGTMV